MMPAGDIVKYLWHLAARRIQEKVADAPPSYLLESRAASAERLRVTSELVDQHATTLETVAGALRSTALDDAAVAGNSHGSGGQGPGAPAYPE